MSVTRRLAQALAGFVVTVLTVSSVPSTPVATAASTFGPQLPDNPYNGPLGTATIHGDSGSSNTTPLPGPGTRQVVARAIRLDAGCRTIVVGSDGLPVAVCGQSSGRTSRVYLLEPNSGTVLASMVVTGDNPGAYLDNAGRLVLVDGGNKLIRIAHSRNKLGLWNLTVAESTSLAAAVPAGDAVTSVAPAYNGKVWFVTGGGSVGIVDTAKGTVEAMAMPDGERIAGVPATAPQGTAVVTTAALYLLGEDSSGAPVVKFRVRHGGGGSAPTFFGPATGGEYLGLVDNAGRQARAKVVKVSSGATLCTTPVFASDPTGSTNSPIGAGRTIVAAGTEGMTRVDVRTDEAGCTVEWHNTTAPAALPRLSIADSLIMTVTRDQGQYSYTAINAGTGAVESHQFLGATPAFDPASAPGTVLFGGVLYQGTAHGIQRIG